MAENEDVQEVFCDQLSQYSGVVWGNVKAALKSAGSPGVEYIDLAEYLDAFRFLFGAAVKHDKILVRDEYRIALQTLQTDEYATGAFITGQPGIGKTLFLVYLLLQLLGKKRVVAVVFTVAQHQRYALFREKVTFHALDDITPMYRGGTTWALVDSNNDLRSPDSIIYRNRLIRTIQATSPRSDRWKEWSKQADAICYVMNFWSEQEIAELAKLLELNVDRMTTLARKWGGVPRILLRYLSQSDSQIELQYQGCAREAAAKSQGMLSMIAGKNILDSAPSLFYFCQPLLDSRANFSREIISACVPTPTLRRLLGESLVKLDNSGRLKFFCSLTQSDQTRVAAGYIFESWFHSFFSAAQSIKCHWLQGFQGVSSLEGTTALIHTTWKELSVQGPPYYWVAPKGFAGIDSALVLDKEIYAFQVTISSEHKSPLKGLQKLRRHLPTNLKNAAWRILFVGEDRKAARMVARQWVDKTPFPTKKAPAHMGWAALDPVQKQVPYSVFHDECDPDVVEPDSEPDEESDDVSMHSE